VGRGSNEAGHLSAPFLVLLTKVWSFVPASSCNALLVLDNHLSPRKQNKGLLHASICRNILKPSLDEVWGSMSVGLAFLIRYIAGDAGLQDRH
jgi:hypothetical protein